MQEIIDNNARVYEIRLTAARDREGAMIAALKTIKNALMSDTRKTIVGDCVVYHLDGQKMHLALNTAREEIAAYDARRAADGKEGA